MRLFVVFGDHSERVAQYLTQEFDVIGHERTLESACSVIKNYNDKPDTFLILGSALVTGFTDGSINYGTVLLSNLRDLRMTCPDSSIKVLLPEKAGAELIDSIVNLGIYDIYKLNQIKLEELIVILKTKKTIADYSASVNTMKNQDISVKDKNVDIISEAEEEDNSSFLDRIKSSRLTESTRAFKNLFHQKNRDIEHGEDFNYEIMPCQSDQTPAQDNTLGKLFTATDHIQTDRPRIVAFGSPWVTGGAADFSAILGNILKKSMRVSAVDCDISSRGLGIRSGLHLTDITNNDWRRTEVPVVLSNLSIFPLDPSDNRNTDADRLTKIINEACKGVSIVILNLGIEPKGWWFEHALKYADGMFWVVSDDPLLMEQARLQWKSRPAVPCRELLLLYGTGDIKKMEDVFTIPCIHIKNNTDKKGFQKLSSILNSPTLKNGKRVLAVGFRNLPEIPNIVWDSFYTVEEARHWIDFNKPDLAVLSDDLKKIDLIEYDLKKISVPVRKIPQSNILSELSVAF